MARAATRCTRRPPPTRQKATPTCWPRRSTHTQTGTTVTITRKVTQLAREIVLGASDFPNGITDKQLMANAIDKVGSHEFRYLLGPGGSLTPGPGMGTFSSGAVQNAAVTDASGNTTPGAQSVATTSTFTVEGPTAVIVNPGAGGTIDVG